MSAVSDSNIVLYRLRAELAKPFPEQGILISVVTEIELLGFQGISVAEEADIRALIANLTVVPLDERVKARRSVCAGPSASGYPTPSSSRPPS